MIGSVNNSPLTEAQIADIGLTIKNTRVNIGISQAKLAKEVGCPVTYIGKLESGKYACDLNSLEQIAQALSVKVSALAGKTTLGKLREKKMEDAQKEAQEIIETTPAEVQVETVPVEPVSDPEADLAELAAPEMPEVNPNIEIPDFIMDKVNQNNHHNIHITDIMVAGLNYFAVLPENEQIPYVMAYIGNKQYYNKMINQCIADGEYAKAKQFIDILEKMG